MTGSQRSFVAPIAIAVLVVIGLVLMFFSPVFEVYQTEQALILQFRQPMRVVSTPGLHLKAPWQSVEYFDKRVLNIDLPEQEVIAQDKKRLVVDAFARWRITDPLRFYQTLIDQDVATARLVPILSSNVRDVLGQETFLAVLAQKRAELMHQIRDGVNAQAKNFGIEIVDVRIRRTDLPMQNSQAIYERMKQERVREANEFRAQGEEISQTLRAEADRQVTVIKADATRDAEITRGQGDAEKNRIFAEAFGKDPEFFAFYRSMNAYKAALPADNTTMVLSPDSEFFRYLERGESGR